MPDNLPEPLPIGPIPLGLLPDYAIREYIPIRPFAEGTKRPGKISYGLTSYGYDIRLNNTYKVFERPAYFTPTVIDPKYPHDYVYVSIEDQSCTIPPNGFALAESVEYIEVPDDVLVLCIGKSTYARCGLIVNVTPLEPGWRGTITLELSNTTPYPVRVHSMEGIAQLIFLRSEKCVKTYASKGGKYQNQSGITPPRVD